MKTILKNRNDIAFYIKLFPLSIHKDAYRKSKIIICERSLKLLDDAMEGKNLNGRECNTDIIDRNISLANSLGISGTPAIILPDGRIISGYKTAGELIRLIDKKPIN